MDTKLVRIRPFNPRAGHKVKTYTLRGIKFNERRGWYRVPVALANYLETILQDPEDSYSKPVFDVCDDKEAKDLELREQKAIEKAKAAEAHDVSNATILTTKDMPRLSAEELPETDTEEKKDADFLTNPPQKRRGRGGRFGK